MFIMDLSLFEKHKEPVKIVKGGPRSQRDEVLEKITDRINECRKKGGFSKMSYVAIATKLKKGGITSEMYWAFHKGCEEYDGPYSEAFFGRLKKHL